MVAHGPEPDPIRQNQPIDIIYIIRGAEVVALIVDRRKNRSIRRFQRIDRKRKATQEECHHSVIHRIDRLGPDHGMIVVRGTVV